MQVTGPQYIKVTAIYIRKSGENTRSTLTDYGRPYIELVDQPKYWNLKKEFEIDEFKPHDKIKIVVEHAIEEYGSVLNSVTHETTYFNYVTFFDRFGITFSLPPYLVATRKVARKTIEKNTEGEITDVKYNGDEETEFQTLALNAGLGIKYHFKRKANYTDSRFGLGLFFMGLDFANSKSEDQQRNDPTNHDFIKRGSFNTMMLAEYSFLNLDNPNVRVPVYAGVVNIFEPLDDGSKWAFVFGLGVDVRLAGKN